MAGNLSPENGDENKKLVDYGCIPHTHTHMCISIYIYIDLYGTHHPKKVYLFETFIGSCSGLTTF